MKREFRKWMYNIFYYTTIILVYYSFCSTFVWGLEEHLNVGLHSKNVFEGVGNQHVDVSKQSIKLKKQSFQFNPKLDEVLYLNFDNQPLEHIGKVLYREYEARNLKNSIGKVASFERKFHKILIKPSSTSFLKETNFIEEFAIFFMFNSYKFQQTATLFSKIHYIKGKKYGILCELKSGKIYFSFFNIFSFNNQPIDIIKIASRSVLKKLVFSNISLTYNKGKLILKINSIIENEIFLTSTKDSRGTIFTAKFHPWDHSPIKISGFNGAIDEFILSNQLLSHVPSIGKYPSLIKKGRLYTQEKGVFSSRVYSIKHSYSLLNKMTYESEEDRHSKIKIYLRHANKYFNANNSSIPYKRIDHLKSLNIQAKYFQWKVNLFADSTGKTSPILKKIAFQYTLNAPPKAPKYVQLAQVPSKLAVDLVFLQSFERDVLQGGRYHIYYGIKPKEPIGIIRYAGFKQNSAGKTIGIPINKSSMMHLSNPLFKNYVTIKIDNQLITQNLIYMKGKPSLEYENPLLQNNVVYYFWVTACDNAWTENTYTSDHESKISNTVSIRIDVK